MVQKREARRPRKSRLRLEAEAELATAPPKPIAMRPAEELLHELQVHQIELQMQNKELRRTHLVLEESRDRYLDLYEFAPVGYVTLDPEGIVLEINLTGANLLGEERGKILGRRFARFVAPPDGDRYHRLLAQVRKSGDRRTFDLELQRGDGSILHAQIDCVRPALVDRPPIVRITLTDITERKRAEAEIERLAFYDPLTGLPNRRLLLQRLRHALAACSRIMRMGAILFLDLDDFKTLNDTQGHDIGDMLLQEVGQRLTGCVREGDTVARLGGDEFVVMIQSLAEGATEAAVQARRIAEKILASLGQRYLLGAHEYRCTCSIGITLFSENEESVEDLLKRADLALYRAKTTGRGTLRFFDPEMQATVSARALLDADLRRALQRGEFFLHYQPQVDERGLLIGAEALVRWQHPDRGLLMPADFIPFAEENGLIEAIGQLVLEAACLQLRNWGEEAATANLTLSINVSALEFSQPEFAASLLAVVDRMGANPRRLMLEFTERVMLGPVAETLARMNALKSRGVGFALDDFGIGYSSLNYLKSLPLDQLKIDKSFVQEVPASPNNSAIARSIIALGESLGLGVIAEGVETAKQRDFLVSRGCRAFQGFLFGEPGPVEALWGKSRVQSPAPAS